MNLLVGDQIQKMFKKAAYILLGLAGLATPVTSAQAASIDLLLVEKLPVPTPRPDFKQTNSVTKTYAAPKLSPLSSGKTVSISLIKGTLEQGLRALSRKDTVTALRIRAGMKAGSLDRKLLAWAIALQGGDSVTSTEISTIARDLSTWPGQKAMQRNAEKALVSENLASRSVVSIFGNRTPVSVEGAMLLASANLKLGNVKAANQTIAPFWREESLSKREEEKILTLVGNALNQSDHRYRMHSMLYRDRLRAGERVAGKAKQFSLAKARAAVTRKASNAGKLLEAVAPSSKQDTGYLFARIEHARRQGKYEKAAKLLLPSTHQQSKLIDPDEWWVERRIVSREMLERGHPKTAYKLASEHSAESASDIADAEFHAGWYALRHLSDKQTARRHFQRILDVTTRPISQARGHYWMARASSGEAATRHYRAAAKHSGTYYGQLAATKLGVKKLSISRAKPTNSERQSYKSNELVRAIKRLEAVGYKTRAEIFYRHLAKEFNSDGELALLALDAEHQGNFPLALQVGKIGYQRGFDVGTLSWPLGAIPSSAKIGNTGRALAYAIARQESTFNKAAVSPANARGLLQLLPGTAKAVAKRQGLKYSFKRLTRDAGYNATLGAAYLSEQLDKFGNSYILTFAAYNAGPRRVEEWIERFGDPRGKSLDEVIDWVERIPFKETRSYVQRVMENYQVYKARIGGSHLTITKDLIRGRG